MDSIGSLDRVLLESFKGLKEKEKIETGNEAGRV